MATVKQPQCFSCLALLSPGALIAVDSAVDSDCIHQLILWLAQLMHTYVMSSSANESKMNDGCHQNTMLLTSSSGDFLHDCYMKVSMHDSEYDGIVRIFMYLS